MLTWYRPELGEVNFLPWQEQLLKTRRRMRFWCYGGVGLVLVFGLSVFAGLYVNLQQVKADGEQQVTASAQQLLVQQRRLWGVSFERRLLRRNQALLALQEYDAWLPIQELTRLLMLLQSTQTLVSWQWQSTDGGQKVSFKVAGQGQWKNWWQLAANALPRLHLDALMAEESGWKLDGNYLVHAEPIALTHSIEVPVPKLFSLQIRPSLLAGSLDAEPVAILARQIADYGTGVEVVRGEGLQVKVTVDAGHWLNLAPIPSAVGWDLHHYSISQAPPGQWLVSMQWLPDRDRPQQELTRGLMNDEDQLSTRNHLQHYAESLQVHALPTPSSLDQISPASNKRSVADVFQFIGYSQQQGEAPVVWIESAGSGLLRAEAGQLIDGWLLSLVGPNEVHLKRGQETLMLKRQCLTGVCGND